MNPWDRLPKESTPAYEAARTYFEMGPERTQEAVGTKLAKSRQLLSRWAAAHSWVERASLYDAHMQGIEQAAIEKARAKEAEKWARRQAEQRDRDWSMAEQLRDKAEKMLGYPLSRTHTEDGKTVVNPARWSMADAVRMAEMAAKLARLAAEMATEHRQVDVTKLTDDELEHIANGHA